MAFFVGCRKASTMALEQAQQTIARHQHISILPSPHAGGDAFLAGLGLFYSLKKLGKNVNSFSMGFIYQPAYFYWGF